MTRRADALADRLEQGANTLADLAATLTDAEWRVRVPRDGRTVGVIVHHVGTMYRSRSSWPRPVAEGKAIAGVTWDAVHEINAKHAREHAGTTREEAIAFLLERRGRGQGDRVLSDEQLDRVAPISLYFDTPLTCQFFLRTTRAAQLVPHGGDPPGTRRPSGDGRRLRAGRGRDPLALSPSRPTPAMPPRLSPPALRPRSDPS